MVNQSQIEDPRFWARWRNEGKVAGRHEANMRALDDYVVGLDDVKRDVLRQYLDSRKPDYKSRMEALYEQHGDTLQSITGDLERLHELTKLGKSYICDLIYGKLETVQSQQKT